jgi:hypothetical protein
MGLSAKNQTEEHPTDRVDDRAIAFATLMNERDSRRDGS